MAFPPDAQVVVQQLDEKNWKLTTSLTYQGSKELFVVPAGMVTDFASVPRAFVWFIPQYGRYTKAAILHDYMWRERAAKGLMRWIDADGIFRRAMRELDVAFLRRWIMWAAVRLGALLKPGGLQEWWREAPRVLLFTLIALPFVFVPAVLIFLKLLAFTLVEFVLWAALRGTRAVKEAIREAPPDKRVNLPRFEWSLS
jgi:Protein of unknown function (DUF1353)